MWHTNDGDRTLDGAEARLFAEALWDFVSELEVEEGDYDVGVDVFDRLTYGQKASLQSLIGNGLLKPKVPVCTLTAAVEGAVAAIFGYLKILVIVEIDEPEIKSSWRKMILAARREAGAESLPDEDCQDYQDWLIEIEEQSYLILWDYDFEDEGLYIDKPPEEAQRLKGLMHMRDDYYTEVAEDLNPGNIETTLSGLKSLCQAVCERSETEKG